MRTRKELRKALVAKGLLITFYEAKKEVFKTRDEQIEYMITGVCKGSNWNRSQGNRRLIKQCINEYFY